MSQMELSEGKNFLLNNIHSSETHITCSKITQIIRGEERFFLAPPNVVFVYIILLILFCTRGSFFFVIRLVFSPVFYRLT